MHLNSIKVSGFKSFAEEVELILEPGITTIVGPNGCGKSNVSDAIRWVLGEKSARALRCTNMRDLLFNGGSKFNPAQKASVSLSFTNISNNLSVESPDVEVGRQLTRDGESSYLINNTPCRLRDISELFMDTGIGVDAYSVMEQSKIDLILNVRPEERRFLFDEVAGITKYKHNRKITLRELEATKQNLVRINDVIQGLESDTESLKKQAEQAQHYQSLHEKLQHLELSLAYKKHEKLVVEYREKQEQLDVILNEVSDVNDLIQESEDRIDSATVRKTELDTVITESQIKIKDISANAEKIERQIVVHKENQLNIGQQRQRALETLEALDIQKSQLQTRKRERTQEKKKLESAHKIEESRLSGRKTVLEDSNSRINRAKETVQDAKSTLQQINTDLAIRENRLISIKEAVTSSQDNLNKIQENTDSLKAEYQSATENFEKIQQSTTLIESDIVQIETEKNKVESTYNEAQNSLRQIESKINGLQESLGGSVTQYNTLKQMQSSYRGYYSGVSAIMQAKSQYPDQFSGICGVVAELIQTDNEFEIAIEIALGSAIQNVIVETAEDADAGIKFLKRNQAGRVTFIPLDIIRRRTFSDHTLLEEPGVIGIAEELVDYDYKYQSAVQHLLGNTLIVEKLDDAIGLRRRFGPNARMVTLDGELINTSGSITGGYTEQRKTGLLSRVNELDVLKSKIEDLTRIKTQNLEKRKRYASTIAETQQTKQKLVTQLQDKQIEKAAILKDKDLAEQNISRLETLIADIEIENKQHQEKIEISRDEKINLDAEIEELSKKQKQTQNKIQRMTEGIDSDTIKRDELVEEIQKREVFLAGQQGKINGMQSELEGFDQSQLHIEQEIIKQQETINNDEQNKQEIANQIEGAERKFLQIEGDRAETEAECDELIQERDGLVNQIETLQKEIRNTRRQHEKQNRLHQQLEVKTTQLEMQLKSNSNRILDKYGVSIDEFPKPMIQTVDTENETESTELDEIDLLDNIEKLKADIAAIGDVNLKAIKTYQEYKKRLDFQITQRDDIQNSIKSAYQAIQKINETSRNEFLKTFEKVKANFQEVFTQLFGGGETELRLTDESEILESGIDIIARPPGKRPQSITQLSGGERSLVAIGLLFAVFKIKPSPFCVLDEVDASLDEANVLRFTNLIRAYSDNTQFVIITHNRRTMEIADVMYGVTMEQAGMSKIVSRKFERR